MVAVVVAMRLEQHVVPAVFLERRVRHVGRRPLVRVPGRLRPLRAVARPVAVRVVVVRVVKEAGQRGVVGTGGGGGEQPAAEGEPGQDEKPAAEHENPPVGGAAWWTAASLSM